MYIICFPLHPGIVKKDGYFYVISHRPVHLNSSHRNTWNDLWTPHDVAMEHDVLKWHADIMNSISMIGTEFKHSEGCDTFAVWWGLK